VVGEVKTVEELESNHVKRGLPRITGAKLSHGAQVVGQERVEAWAAPFLTF